MNTIDGQSPGAGLSIGDVKVTTPADVSSRLRGITGTTANVTVVRDKRETTLTVNIEADRAARPRNRAEVDERF